MALCKHGTSRQEAHEKIRQLSFESNLMVKGQGQPNDLMDRIRRDPFFEPVLPQLDHLLDPKTFVGLAPLQVEKFTSKSYKLTYCHHFQHLGTKYNNRSRW